MISIPNQNADAVYVFVLTDLSFWQKIFRMFSNYFEFLYQERLTES